MPNQANPNPKNASRCSSGQGPPETPFLTLVLLSSIFSEEVVMTAKTSISLTDDQEAYARSLVENGQFSSLSAVLQRGLEMLRRDRETQDAELQALRSLIDQRRAGAFVDVDMGETKTRAMINRKRNTKS